MQIRDQKTSTLETIHVSLSNCLGFNEYLIKDYNETREKINEVRMTD